MTVTVSSQPVEALGHANRVRFAQSAVHRELCDLEHFEARDRAAGLLLDPPVDLASLHVGVLLAWIPYLGERRVGRLLGAHRMSGSRSLRSLTERQAAALAAVLRDRGEHLAEAHGGGALVAATPFSQGQRVAALEQANEVRVAAAAEARAVAQLSTRDALTFVAALIDGDAGAFERYRLHRVLRAVSGVGACRVDQIVRGAGITSADRQLRTYTSQQRQRIAGLLRMMAVNSTSGGVRRPASTGQQRILAVLADAEPGGVLARDLAERLGVPPRAIGPRLCGLERRGLVRRVAGGEPYGWQLTEAGWQQVAR